MNLLRSAKEWIRRMFSKQEIKKAYGDINVAVSESMAFAINEWDNMYCGRASWVNEKQEFAHFESNRR